MTEPSPGARSLVSRRALEEIVRSAVVGSYGVVGFSDDGVAARLARVVGLGRPGLVVTVHPELTVHLRLVVAYGLPVAEVARQVDSAVRYAVRRAVGQEPAAVTIHVGGLRYETASHDEAGPPPEPPAHLDPDVTVGPGATSDADPTPGDGGPAPALGPDR